MTAIERGRERKKGREREKDRERKGQRESGRERQKRKKGQEREGELQKRLRVVCPPPLTVCTVSTGMLGAI